MSKRAKERAFEHYATSTNPKNESIRRKKVWAYVLGYEQAEKDVVERAIVWLKENWREYVWTTDNGISHFGHWENDFRKAMEEE